MNCNEETRSLKGLPLEEINRILKKERNDSLSSRQKWIRAAFDLKYQNDDTLFNQLVEGELCEKCVTTYKL